MRMAVPMDVSLYLDLPPRFRAEGEEEGLERVQLQELILQSSNAPPEAHNDIIERPDVCSFG